MSEIHRVNLSDMFNERFPATEERLEQAYRDPIVRERYEGMIDASTDELPSLQAQLNVYLAAAYTLFPEESQIIHDSLNRIKSHGDA